MSNIALGEDGLLHYADKMATDKYSGKYFCPGCGIKMYHKNDGPASKDKKAVAPYFTAYPSPKHVEGCEYDSRGRLGRRIRADNFEFDDLFTRIMKPGGYGVKKPRWHRKNPACKERRN